MKFVITFIDAGNCPIYETEVHCLAYISASDIAWDRYRYAGHDYNEVQEVRIRKEQ